MERKYLNAGKEHNDTKDKKIKLNEAIASLRWHDLPIKEMGFMQCFALKQMINEMGHNPDKVAEGILDRGLGLLAMRNNYSNGTTRRATVYAVDSGDILKTVAVDEETESDISSLKWNNKTSLNEHNLDKMLKNDFRKYSPQYNGLLRTIDVDLREKNEHIIYAIKTYGFLLPHSIPFRICYLGQLIREYYDCIDNDRNKLLSDLLIVNGKHLCPFIKAPGGTIRQL